MADSNGKEHVVIANCSRECHALPSDVGLWVPFVPDFSGVILMVHDDVVLHSLYSISKAEFFCWLFLSAGHCM